MSEEQETSFPRPGWSTSDGVTYTKDAPPSPESDPEDLPFEPLPESKQ
jgi:hypothetical protein